MKMSSDLEQAAQMGFLEQVADPSRFIICACEEAKRSLRDGDLEQAAQVKRETTAIHPYMKRMSRQAAIAVGEVTRRAERGIGVGVRRGQADGTIKTGKGIAGGKGRPVTDFTASYDDLSNSKASIYHMTDGVTDEEFEEVLAEAVAEGNLTRRNVVRKIWDRHGRPQPRGGEGEGEGWIPKPSDRRPVAATRRRQIIRESAARGYTSRQISELTGILAPTIRDMARREKIPIPADTFVANTRHPDSNRIAGETIHALEGLVMGVQLIDPGALDPGQAAVWSSSLSESVRVLARLAKTMKAASHE
jgi:hypothetical protein